MKLDLTLYIKINSKWIYGINIRAKTTEHLEEYIKINRHDLEFGKELLDLTPQVPTTKEKKKIKWISDFKNL